MRFLIKSESKTTAGIRYFLQKKMGVLTVTLSYYLALYFSTSNTTFFFISCLYFFVLTCLLKNLKLAAFLALIATLPFAKGKGLDILLLDKEHVMRNALFNINYVFPVYTSDFFFFVILFLYLREKIFMKKKVTIPKEIIFILCSFTLFMFSLLISGKESLFQIVVLLSSIQVAKLGIFLVIPFLVSEKKNQKMQYFIYLIIVASLLFQSGWGIFQHVRGGNLGRDIEVYLPGSQSGIFASENQQIYRSIGTFFEPSIYATFLIMSVGVLLYNMKEQKYIVVVTLFSLLLAITSLFFTASRGAYVIAIGIIIFFIITNWQTVKAQLIKYKKFWLLGLLIVPICLSFVFVRVQNLPTLFIQNGSGNYRIQIAQYGLRLAEVSPLGVGLNLSPYYFATGFSQEKYFFDPAHPHNIFIQLLAESGVVGLALFVIFLWTLFRPLMGNDGKRNWNEYAIASLIFLLCAQIYPIFINQQEILSFFFLFAGLHLHKIYAKK